jgi:hypothetical protein
VIEFAVPQVSDTAEPFRSPIRQVIRGRTEELERLAVEMYARGLSVRDIEAAFTDESGRCVLTKSAASEVTECQGQPKFPQLCKLNFPHPVHESFVSSGRTRPALSFSLSRYELPRMFSVTA